MNDAQAEALLDEWLSPLHSDAFFAAIGRSVVAAQCSTSAHARTRLFGPQPDQTLLEAFATHSERLECHGPAPTAPPPASQQARDAHAFHALIRRYHERGYTVRVPDVISLSPPLQQFARALECVFQQPVAAALFWSRQGATAKVHYDNRDNIVVQLKGRKRWLISSEEPLLQNEWAVSDGTPPQLKDPRILALEPGDLIYVPRGIAHTVESTTESLHLAILFKPVTIRDTLIAAIDHLSDIDRSLRTTALGNMAQGDLADLPARVADAARQVMAHCASPDFLKETLQHRAARFISDLPPLRGASEPLPVTADTRVRHAPLAIANVRTSGGYLRFSQPGGNISIHPAVEPQVQFIASTSEFRVGDVPGNVPPQIRQALVGKLIESGFLQHVNEQAQG